MRNWFIRSLVHWTDSLDLLVNSKQDLRILYCSCPIHRAYRGRDAPPTPPSVPPQAGGRALTVRLRKS